MNIYVQSSDKLAHIDTTYNTSSNKTIRVTSVVAYVPGRAPQTYCVVLCECLLLCRLRWRTIRPCRRALGNDDSYALYICTSLPLVCVMLVMRFACDCCWLCSEICGLRRGMREVDALRLFGGLVSDFATVIRDGFAVAYTVVLGLEPCDEFDLNHW